jgi:regulator of replication initiation timing
MITIEKLQARIEDLFTALENEIDKNDKLEAQNKRLRELLDPTEKE